MFPAGRETHPQTTCFPDPLRSYPPSNPLPYERCHATRRRRHEKPYHRADLLYYESRICYILLFIIAANYWNDVNIVQILIHAWYLHVETLHTAIHFPGIDDISIR